MFKGVTVDVTRGDYAPLMAAVVEHLTRAKVSLLVIQRCLVGVVSSSSSRAVVAVTSGAPMGWHFIQRERDSNTINLPKPNHKIFLCKDHFANFISYEVNTFVLYVDKEYETCTCMYEHCI